jgi:cytidine deaminase
MMSDQALFEKALEAQKKSYSPYSNFKVGAALLTKSGELFLGANIENASYGLAVCAERNAIFAAILAGQKEFAKMAVVCACETECLPCGACRQVIAEFAPELPMLLGVGSERFNVTSLKELLPNPFLPEYLLDEG